MKISRSLIILTLMGCYAMAQFNDTPEVVSKVATSTGNWLKLGADVRSLGMGGVSVASGYGVSGIPSNPSLIAFIDKSQAYYSKVNYLADISHQVIAVGSKVGRSDFVGVHLFYLDSGPIEITTVEEPEGTGTDYNVASIALRTSYARRLTDRLKVGISLNYIHDRIDNIVMQSFAFDLGSNFATGINGFILGMTVSNFGPEVTYFGEGLTKKVVTELDASGEMKKVTRSFPLPLAFRLGVSNNLVGPNSYYFTSNVHRVTAAVEGINPQDFLVTGNMGLEYAWQEMAFLRFGSHLGHDTGRFSSGAGFRYRADRLIVTIDYAFVNYGILESTHQIGVGMEF